MFVKLAKSSKQGSVFNTSGQAVVELMLLMALLVPVLIYTVNTLREGIGGELTKFLEKDIGTQVRYGYSYDELRNHPGGFDVVALPNIRGRMPITMSVEQAVQDKYQHPVQKVQEGWMP
jgi:hypothetical protein